MTRLREPKSAEECAYISRRAADAEGNKFMIWVFKETPTVMHIKYTCGRCGNQGEITDEYGLPYKMECSKCGALLKIEPLKGKKKGNKRK